MSDHQSKARQTRMKILAAASQLAKEQGIAQVTLEQTAKRAGVSKGGLLYHFPSKEALMSGMIEYFLESYDHELQLRKKAQEGKGAFLRAFLEMSELDEQYKDLSMGMFAAMLTNPQLLASVRAYYQEWQKQAEEDGIDPVLATVIRLAGDGLFFADLFDLEAPRRELREKVLQLLKRWAREKEK